jgi:hypothetical protein
MAKRYKITDPATGQVYNTPAESPDEAKAKIETYIKANPQPAGGAAAAPKKEPAADPGFFQQKGNVTRGWGADKKMTEEARGRTGLMHLPTDIAAGVATSPYTIGGPVTGAVFGAGEGALRSYGDQEGWAPEWGNIGDAAKKGALLGGAGYALPGAWNAVKGGLQKVGNIPKTTTAIADYFTSGMPVFTGASTASKVGSAVMPKAPTGDAFRDILSKYMMGMGAN